MHETISHRLRRIYDAICATEESDPKKLKADVVVTEKAKVISQDFCRGLSGSELSNQVYIVIYNIASLRDHLRRWAKDNGWDKGKVDQTFNNSLELKIIQDLSNYERHGKSPRNGGNSRKSPRLVEIRCVMRLQTQVRKGAAITMATDAGGSPKFIGDGTAKAVVTADVIDNNKKRIGDLYEIANTAVKAWEQLLADFGSGDAVKAE